MLEHGGKLRAAARRWNIPLADWLDLSTGIAPRPYPVPAVPAEVWQRLPEDDDGLEAAACDYYGARHLLPMSGSQAAIQMLPRLFAPGRVAIPAPIYNEHPGLSFVGALAAMMLVFGLAHGDGSWTQTRLLLTGVIVAAGCGALVALILTLAPEQKIHSMLFWLMGDLSQSSTPLPALGVLVAALLVALPFARELNLLARGADQALALGVAVPMLRRVVYLTASLATAAAVTTAG